MNPKPDLDGIEAMGRRTVEGIVAGLVVLSEQSLDRGVEQYRSRLRSAVRGLWSGALDAIDTGAMFDLAIRSSFTQAYNDGALDSGVQPSELTPEERAQRERLIADEYGFVDGFLQVIEQGSKDNGGSLAPLFSRVELWVTRYRQAYTSGQATARDDPKMLWVRSALESCPSCLAVDGKIKRLSTWKAAGFMPQSPRLQCQASAKGVTVCKCHLERTDAPMSRGPLPVSTLVRNIATL